MDNGKDDFYAEDQETHATVLDKLLAWEKKLFDEVKVHSSVIFLIIVVNGDYFHFCLSMMEHIFIVMLIRTYLSL